MAKAQTAKEPTGKAVKLSQEVWDHLSSLKDKGESYDGLLRRHFGLPNRYGKPQPLRTYFIVETEQHPACRRTLADARGEAILLSVKEGIRSKHRQAHAEVIAVREIPA